MLHSVESKGIKRVLYIAFHRFSKEEQEMLKKKWKTTSSKQNSKQTSWLWWEDAWRLGLLLIGKRWCRHKAWVHCVLCRGSWDPRGPHRNRLKPETGAAFKLYRKLLWSLINCCLQQCSPEGCATPAYAFTSPWRYPQNSAAQGGKPISQLKGRISGSRKDKANNLSFEGLHCWLLVLTWLILTPTMLIFASWSGSGLHVWQLIRGAIGFWTCMPCCLMHAN